MRVFAAVLALVWTLLLGAIAVELHTLNGHLAWISGPIKGLAAIGREAQAEAAAETREQRIERRARDIREASAESAEVLKRALRTKGEDKSPTAQPSPK